MTVNTYVTRFGLSVDSELAAFLEAKVLPAANLDASRFWSDASALFSRFAPENAALLERRDELQDAIDRWHEGRRSEAFDAAAYKQYLRDIGYIVAEPAPFSITTDNVDEELARRAGPQLVVPVLNARFLLNAANARWGSLYDALYGSDVFDPAPAAGGGYDRVRGDRVIAWSKNFLDRVAPLKSGSHADVTAYAVLGGALSPALADPTLFAGYAGDAAAPSHILLRHHGLHIIVRIDRDHVVGRTDAAGVADIELEAALTTIVDFEDSVAVVDAEDKLAGYRNWFALLRGDLEAKFEKNGAPLTRRLAEDRRFLGPSGAPFVLPGKSTLLVRNVGLHMATPALLMESGAWAYEGLLDAIVTTLIGKTDLMARRYARAGAGSIYIVKPKLHGPEEAAFIDRVFRAVETMLELPEMTVKIGLMDEERRTSANLAASIRALRHRLVFINTGFLDRTGDEIHTSMAAGPMRTKSAMKSAAFLRAYEDRNVRIGLRCGLAGRAQIGKGMWAAPNRLGDMMQQKRAHPEAGANTAWVPSPTAATLHAVHYHEVDVAARQRAIADEPIPALTDLLTIPLAEGTIDAATRAREIDANVQSILGYVVRWINDGIGCSTVPDIDGIGLMEDRATLRISSQLIANWLKHNVCSAGEVEAAIMRLARTVDRQNEHMPGYAPMSANPEESLAVSAARALIFEGVRAANGYTETALERYRRARKSAR